MSLCADSKTRPLFPTDALIEEFFLGCVLSSMDKSITENRLREILLIRYRREIRSAAGLKEEDSYTQRLFIAGNRAMRNAATSGHGTVSVIPGQGEMLIFRSSGGYFL